MTLNLLSLNKYESNKQQNGSNRIQCRIKRGQVGKAHCMSSTNSLICVFRILTLAFSVPE